MDLTVGVNVLKLTRKKTKNKHNKTKQKKTAQGNQQ
jgi:hypothetical protein